MGVAEAVEAAEDATTDARDSTELSRLLPTNIDVSRRDEPEAMGMELLVAVMAGVAKVSCGAQ